MSSDNTTTTLKCGNCGHDSFAIQQREDGDLLTTCKQCQSTTVISIRASLSFDWGKDSDGILCKM